MSAKDALASVPSLLATAFGHGTTEWRATIGSGAYATLTGAHQGQVQVVYVFDEAKGREVQQQECQLVVPYTSTELAIGYQVRTSDLREWAVVALADDAQHGLRGYTLRRDPLVRFTPDRGLTP